MLNALCIVFRIISPNCFSGRVVFLTEGSFRESEGFEAF